VLALIEEIACAISSIVLGLRIELLTNIRADSCIPSGCTPDTPMADLGGQLEAYFETLGLLGQDCRASDAAGTDLPTGEAVARFLALAEETKRARARIMFIGNGGSAGICSHMATDWLKNGGFYALAFNDSATLTCLSNDLGYAQVFAKQVEMHCRPGDLLVAISSSGNSANILNGVTAARAADAAVVTLSGFAPDNKLRKVGDINFYVPNPSYGFVEIAHLAICHAVLDLSMGWRARTAVSST
jgi:D-sedoheptulose 7-phosphate isomerase